MLAPKVKGVSLLTFTLALTGFILNWFSIMNCDFVRLNLTYGSADDLETFALHYGIWSHQAWNSASDLDGTVVLQGCSGYANHADFGSATKWLQATSSMALILTLGLASIHILSTVSGRRIASPFFQCAGYITASISMGLTLLILNSTVCTENAVTDQFQGLFPHIDFDIAGCSLSTGSNCAIAATVFYFFAGASCFAECKEENAGAQFTVYENMAVDCNGNDDKRERLIPEDISSSITTNSCSCDETSSSEEAIIESTSNENVSYIGLLKYHKEYRWYLSSSLVTDAGE